MTYTVPYQLIDESVEAIINSRMGMNNPKVAFTKNRIHQELMGSIMGIVKEFQISESDVREYFDITMNHKFKALPTDGQVHLVHHYVDERLVANPLYFLLETTLMKFKPASVQVGTGEFFFCWYDKDSVFGIDNQLSYDVKVSGLELELKGLKSNLTASEAKFDQYMEICDGIMVVGSYDNRNEKGEIKKATTRSTFCINTTDWTESFEFHGDTLKYVDQKAQLDAVREAYKMEKAA